MKLLGLNLPSVQRIQFANLESKNVWGNKINNAKNIYPTLEYETVIHDVRKCMIDHYTNRENLMEKTRFYSKRGLYIIPMEENRVGEGFNHKGNANGKLQYRSVVAKTLEDAEQFLHYHKQRDDVNIGLMLGFPKESCEFFKEVWEKGYFDPLWQQAENTKEPMLKNKRDFTDSEGRVNKKLIRLRSNEDSYLINPAFRYFNIRMTSHFAKSFDDIDSIEVAKKWLQVAKDIKIDGLDDLLDILKLPYEWDCYKGIAVINTPVFKMTVTSMDCFPHHVIQQESDFYPEEAPNGIKFPWKIYRRI